jgi:ribosomal protein L28
LRHFSLLLAAVGHCIAAALASSPLPLRQTPIIVLLLLVSWRCTLGSARLIFDSLTLGRLLFGDRRSNRFIHDTASNERRHISCAKTRRRWNISKVTRWWVRNINDLFRLLLFNNCVSYLNLLDVAQYFLLFFLLILFDLSLFLLKKLGLLVIGPSENNTCERVLLELGRPNHIRQLNQQISA